MTDIKIISIEEANDLLDNKEAILVDVRSKEEHHEEYIEGSYLHPLDTINLNNIKHDNKKIILHCKSGKRSLEACKKLLEQHPSLELYSLDGGINAWSKSGCKTCKSGVISIQRQVMITAGVMIIIGFILGFELNNKYFWLCAIVGTGLTYAGISGNCYMGMLLAKMPWNKNI